MRQIVFKLVDNFNSYHCDFMVVCFLSELFFVSTLHASSKSSHGRHSKHNPASCCLSPHDNDECAALNSFPDLTVPSGANQKVAAQEPLEKIWRKTSRVRMENSVQLQTPMDKSPT